MAIIYIRFFDTFLLKLKKNAIYKNIIVFVTTIKYDVTSKLIEKRKHLNISIDLI